MYNNNIYIRINKSYWLNDDSHEKVDVEFFSMCLPIRWWKCTWMIKYYYWKFIVPHFN